MCEFVEFLAAPGRRMGRGKAKMHFFLLICIIYVFCPSARGFEERSTTGSQSRVDGLKSQSGTFSKGNTNVYKHIYNFVFLASNE